MAREPWEKEKWERGLHQDIAGDIRENIRENIRERMRGRPCNRHSGSGGVVVGAIIVAAGVILLLDNMGVVRAGDLWQYWPVALIAVGLSRILESRRPTAVAWGAITAGVGVLLLLDKLNIIFFSFNLIFPLLIIGFGASMLLRAKDRSQVVGDTRVAGDPNVAMYAIFGGGRRRIDSPDFRSAEVFAIFGGFHIDLKGAQVPAGRAVVEVNSIFGGVEMFVPDTWRVVVQGTGIFGAFEDKTLAPRPDVSMTAPQLIITGSAIFGGVTIRN